MGQTTNGGTLTRLTVARRLGMAVRLACTAHPAAVIVLVVGTITAGALPVATAWLTKVLLETLAPVAVSGRIPLAALTGVVAGMAAVAVLSQIVANGLGYVQIQLGRRLEYLVQARLFEKINTFPGLAHFEQPKFYDRMRLAQQAGSSAPRQIVDVGAGLLQTTVSVVGFMGALLAVSPLIAILVLASAIPHLIAEIRLSKARVGLLNWLSPAQRRKFFYSSLLSTPNAAKEIRLFDLGRFFHTRMLTELRDINDAEQALDRRRLRIQALLGVLSAAVSAVALFLVVREATLGNISIGDIALFLAALAGVTAGSIALIQRMASGSEGLLLIAHYEDFMAAEDEPRSARSLPPASARPVPPLTEAIEFQDVWFRYDEDLPWILQGVTLRISRGQAVALVGLNGAGKSTLVKLLCRLHEPVKGSITWNGVDVRAFDHASLRQRMGSVFQDYMAYDLTGAENIGLGDLPRLEDRPRLHQAAQRAGVHDALKEMPRGYDTMLSRIYFLGPAKENEDPEAGVVLSGGQWQRLALARMLMRFDRDLLILDEPSSGLDAEAEHAIHRTVYQHAVQSEKTSLLISHRLNAVRMADIIVVLQDGRIVEQGSHAELMAAAGRYAELFTLQASGYRDEESSRNTIPLSEFRTSSSR